MLLKVDANYQKKDTSKKESGIYTSLQAAIDAAKEGDTISLAPGVYKEKVEIRTNNIKIKGLDPISCIITYDDYALKLNDQGDKLGTFRSYTCLLLADKVTFENLTIENSAGDGRQVGQAVALFAQGDELTFVNCNFTAYQDTIFAGPLPEKPRIPGSFVGPTEHIAYKQCKMYFEKCQITGDVDYIFGSALCVFNHCMMMTRDRGEAINGYVTAPSTWKDEAYGFVFLNSSFVGQEGIKKSSVYLGRPWREYGQSIMCQCSFDESLHEDIWDPWGNPKNFETANFKENVSEDEVKAILHPWHINLLHY